jgi:hypothetical protein
MNNFNIPNLKEYAKKYGISVMKKGKFKTVNQLSNDIYRYEVDRGVKKGFYPFLTGKSY